MAEINSTAATMTVPRLRSLMVAVDQFAKSEEKYADTLESLGQQADRHEIAEARTQAARAREALAIIMVRFPKQASQLDKE